MKSDVSTIAAGCTLARPGPRVAHCLLHLGVLASFPALAASDQVLRPYVAYGVAHDDNVLGMGDGTAASGGAASSTSRHAEAGLVVDKRINQQVLSAALQFTHITYDQLPELDNNAKNLSVNWNWHVGN